MLLTLLYIPDVCGNRYQLSFSPLEKVTHSQLDILYTISGLHRYSKPISESRVNNLHPETRILGGP